jgi:hypothetical protein
MVSRDLVPIAGGCPPPCRTGKPLQIAVDSLTDTMVGAHATYRYGPGFDVQWQPCIVRRTMATPTRTYNPLPFTDLEPKRFEDLVRQLVYDFRTWRRLEATGRAGSDDGFDARGLEMVQDVAFAAEPTIDEDTEEEATEEASFAPDRLWLVQCKRERTLPPAKLKAHLAAIKLNPEEKLHGIIFAAACDFSKLARDLFFAWCRDQGISEAFLWGKGELEDQLFQPKNDNLLFAYFGISLAIRRRSQATQLRAVISTKRKLKRLLATGRKDVLLRDPLATDYPRSPKGERPKKWRPYEMEEISYHGLIVTICWFQAYLEAETGEWDAADALPVRHVNDPWKFEDEPTKKLHDAASDVWHAFPEENKAWLRVYGIVPFNEIIAIDDVGDDIFDGPHIYLSFDPARGPFDGQLTVLETIPLYAERTAKDDQAKRIVKFPPETRNPPKEGNE